MFPNPFSTNPSDQPFLIAPCFRNNNVTSIPNAAFPNLGACITDTIRYYTQFLFLIVFIVSFFIIILAGYQMITAFGNEAQMAQGKKTLQYAVLGMIIAVVASLLVNAFVGLLQGQAF